jgi:hypothetical protein
LDLELSAEDLKTLMEQAKSTSDSHRVLMRGKWLVESAMAAGGAASFSSAIRI